MTLLGPLAKSVTSLQVSARVNQESPDVPAIGVKLAILTSPLAAVQNACVPHKQQLHSVTTMVFVPVFQL